ncbi:70 kDa peptidyl-prolyl isomerase [Bienertia sinuspersici]
MASLEIYENLKKEILNLIGDDVLDEDELFLNLISTSEDSRRVLDLAQELKEKGNSLLKQGHMDDALEQYGYAQLILARYNFVKENDRIEFLKLAICILISSAVCFSKKKEFVQVGQTCSVVLEFDPNNVKAMFKRAVAAIELGKHDWAMLDLLTTTEIDPNN